MTNDDLNRALERLRSYTSVALEGKGIPPGVTITKPLVALIEAAAKPWYSEGVSWCRSCARRIDSHFDDCALVALVRAINGDNRAP